MKITDLNQLGVGGTGSSQSAGGVEGRSAQQTAQKGALRDDRADLSGVAERMLEATAETTPERQAKIDRLRQLYSSDQYRVDSAQLSKALVDDALTNEK